MISHRPHLRNSPWPPHEHLHDIVTTRNKLTEGSSNHSCTNQLLEIRPCESETQAHEINAPPPRVRGPDPHREPRAASILIRLPQSPASPPRFAPGAGAWADRPSWRDPRSEGGDVVDKEFDAEQLRGRIAGVLPSEVVAGPKSPLLEDFPSGSEAWS